jgi:phosphate uptake regulator/aminoglycoside phosphotransferase
MRLPKGIRDNLRFLLVETGAQVDHLQGFFETCSPSVARRVLDRSGYAASLKDRIHDSCYRDIAGASPRKAAILRTVQQIATELLRISGLCCDCIHQFGHLEEQQRLCSDDFSDDLQQVAAAIGSIEAALQQGDTQQALRIGRVERRLDRSFRRQLKQFTARMKRSKHPQRLISSLFVAQAIEQMGDALLDIGEAIISFNLGQPVDMQRYRMLLDSVQELGDEESSPDLGLTRIAETRSGSGISALSSQTDDKAYRAIVKDGAKRKLKEEHQSVRSWHEIYPGLAPRILSYKKRGQSAALLIEHLAGQTFEQIVLHESDELVTETLKRLGKTCRSVWKETRMEEAASAGYMAQLQQRMPDVYAVHPEYRQDKSRLCGAAIPSFDQQMRRAGKLEAQLKAPFSVYIHGDFNVDNVIYDPLDKRINFIDLHRSDYMDYVQDVSVFMVSNYRLHVLDRPLRRRIHRVARDFCAMARRFAHKSGDTTFEIRLALALARSFASSTRFILDASLADGMFLRARYLLDRVLETPVKRAGRFRTPVEQLFSG